MILLRFPLFLSSLTAKWRHAYLCHLCSLFQPHMAVGAQSRAPTHLTHCNNGVSINFSSFFPLHFPPFHFFFFQFCPSLAPPPPRRKILHRRFRPKSPLPNQLLHSDPRSLQLQSPKLPHVSAEVPHQRHLLGRRRRERSDLRLHRQRRQYRVVRAEHWFNSWIRAAFPSSRRFHRGTISISP